MKILINCFCILNIFLLNILNVKSCNRCYLSTLSCFEVNSGELKKISFAISDIGVVEIYEKSCKQRNNLIEMKGYTVSAAAPVRHNSLDGYLGGYEPNILIVGIARVKNQFVIKDTLSISDERGYFETQFRRNDFFYIGVVQRSNKMLYAYSVKRRSKLRH